MRLGRTGGDLMRERRRELGLTQQELAGYVGVTQAHICAFERGQSSLSYERAARAEKFLQLPRTTLTSLLPGSCDRHIFVLFGSVEEPWLKSLLIALQGAVQAAGLTCQPIFSRGNYEGNAYRHTQQTIIGRRRSYGGGIVCPPVCIYEDWDNTKRFITDFGQPLVFVDYHPRLTESRIPGRTSFIGFDDDYGGHLAGEAILSLRRTVAEKRFQRLAIISGKSNLLQWLRSVADGARVSGDSRIK
jgi:transcriptional regulator with XRE-family HTH domain